MHFYKRYLDYKYAAFIQYDYNDDDNIFTIYWINDSENGLVIEYEIDEFSYESYGDKELKILENILLNVSSFFEQNRDRLNENPEKLFVILSEILDRQSSIKHEEFAKAIEKLENKIDKISLYKVADNLPSKHKNNRYFFLMNEVSSTTLRTLRAIQLFQMNLIKNNIEEIKKEINSQIDSLQRFLNEELFSLIDMQQFLVENIKFLNSYCMEFEIVFRNFVKPIYYLLDIDNLLPKLKKKEYESNTGLYIRQVKCYLKRNPEYKPLIFLIENLNAEIRNAIIHQNYYIDEESSKLVYYFLPKLPKGIKKLS